MMKQMRERAGNLQPQFLLMALLLSIYQPHGFAGKVWKAELPVAGSPEAAAPWKASAGRLEHSAFELKLHCEVILIIQIHPVHL